MALYGAKISQHGAVFCEFPNSSSVFTSRGEKYKFPTDQTILNSQQMPFPTSDVIIIATSDEIRVFMAKYEYEATRVRLRLMNCWCCCCACFLYYYYLDFDFVFL